MRRAAITLAGACLALAACATTIPDPPDRTDVVLPEEFTADFRPPPGTGEAWWTGFDDPQLDALIEQALAENLDIAATRERLLTAQALLRAERSDRLPTADGGVSGGLDLNSADLVGSLSAGADLIFQPDISGRLSAEIQAAAARAQAIEYLVADRNRLIAAAVAEQYIELRRTGERLLLLEQSTELQERTLRIVTLRFEAGLSANLDVRRAAADLAQTRAQRGLLDLQRAEATHALAVLTGEIPGATPGVPEPGTEGETAGGIPVFAGGPPRGTPADLLRRRPDLLVAETDLVEAAALVGIERSDLVPALALSGRALIGDGSIGGIVSDFLLGVGAALDLPLFDGGRRRAEIEAAEFELAARFAEYRQTILLALAEVENALVAISAYSARGEDLSQAIAESEQAYEQSDALYREGLATLFDVLDSQRQLINSREALIDSEAALAQSIVALYAAVGDGEASEEDG